METKIIKINEHKFEQDEFSEAVQILRTGGLVAFPTETVYGLGGDGLRADAAKKIYEAKGRPSDNPLILHIADLAMLSSLAEEIPDAAQVLAKKFWPGPLTMIFKKKREVPFGTTGGLDSVAVRMPSHKVARELIRLSGVCIAAPSANTSGRPSPTKASHVIDDLMGKIDMIIDGGEVGIGIESTIVDLTGERPTILRPGFITQRMLEKAVGEVRIDPAVLSKKADPNLVPKAPGMKYKHYAPKAELTIMEGALPLVTEEINRRCLKAQCAGKRVGVICSCDTKQAYTIGIVKEIGDRKQEITIAQRLYSILREFDDLGVDIIYSESFASDDLGQAIMNRLLKAAGYQVVCCE
ncbi:MAG: L-threonylcarbamoyladenylate synthase [Clostridiales bacterium]|nr:L-threonylcarbamoyladenylate synthase [Clostridiales bacterium]